MENLEGLTLEERERLLKVRKKIQLIKAREYVKSGGSVDAIKSKYKLTVAQEQQLNG